MLRSVIADAGMMMVAGDMSIQAPNTRFIRPVSRMECIIRRNGLPTQDGMSL